MTNPTYSGPRVTIVLTDDLLKALRHYIVDKGLPERSKSTIIQNALEAFLKAEGALPA